jgi:hypothetical protein
MRLTNDCYLITLRFRSGVEQYFKDDGEWTKLTTRGRRMPSLRSSLALLCRSNIATSMS